MQVRLIFRSSLLRTLEPRRPVPPAAPTAPTAPPAVDWPLVFSTSTPPVEAATTFWTVRTATGEFECPHEVLRSLGEEAIAGYGVWPSGGAEIGGVLYGRRKAGSVQVVSYRLLDCEHEYGPAFHLSAPDEKDLEIMLASPPPSLVPVGWFFSQYQNPRLTAEAIDLHKRRFGEPWQVVLVFGRARLQPLLAGLFTCDAAGSLNRRPKQKLTMELEWRFGYSREMHTATAMLRRIS